MTAQFRSLLQDNIKDTSDHVLEENDFQSILEYSSEGVLTTYAPLVFAQIRTDAGLSLHDFMSVSRT